MTLDVMPWASGALFRGRESAQVVLAVDSNLHERRLHIRNKQRPSDDWSQVNVIDRVLGLGPEREEHLACHASDSVRDVLNASVESLQNDFGGILELAHLCAQVKNISNQCRDASVIKADLTLIECGTGNWVDVYGVMCCDVSWLGANHSRLALLVVQ